ncbi:MAG: NlpC/P60 family protein [bacterium]|nr:NlpC/P60 family protein [bacterium]
MMHWAFPLIGKPWLAGAVGPNAFDCWGLVRYVQRQQRGIEMPPLAVGELQSPEQLEGLHDLVRRSHWHRQPEGTAPAEYDIFLMRSRAGPHVGVVIDVGGQLRVLHAVGDVDSPGSVIHSSFLEVSQLWGRSQIWRYIENEK